MPSLAGRVPPKTLTVRVASEAAVGALWAAFAWWLNYLLIREHSGQPFRVEGLTLILLGFAGIALISIGVIAWSRAAGLAGGAVLIAGAILGGYGSGRALISSNPVEENLGFVLSMGGHHPAIYVLLGAWVGGLAWHFLSRFRQDTRSASPSAPD